MKKFKESKKSKKLFRFIFKTFICLFVLGVCTLTVLNEMITEDMITDAIRSTISRKAVIDEIDGLLSGIVTTEKIKEHVENYIDNYADLDEEIKECVEGFVENELSDAVYDYISSIYD